MNAVTMRFALQLLTVAVVVATCAIRTYATDGAPTPGSGGIREFTLNDATGAKRSFSEWNNRPVLVVVFLGAECPLAKVYASRLVDMQEKYADRGVQFLGINPNQQDTLQEIAGFETKYSINFPLLKDPGAKIADEFGATRTPEAFVLDKRRMIHYQGRIDDQYGVGSARLKATKSELSDAIEALLAGKPAPVARTQGVGCLIGRREPSRQDGEVTYSKHIAPILQNRCVNCHREGQIGPFALTNYEDVAAWSDMCLEVIGNLRMPPWGANPEHGEFANDPRLSDLEKELFRKWVEAGVPEGDPADLPEPRQFADGWQIPRPDAVYEMPVEFEVPATGTIEYQYFVWDPGFKEDKWVYAAEARPGNPEVVHHLFLFYIPPGKDDADPKDALMNAVAAFAPGMPAIAGHPEYAFKIPAGSKLAFQVHYTPNGRATTDRSKAAVLFADPAKVRTRIRIDAAMNPKFIIPPHHPDYEIHATKKIRRDTTLYTLTPHMHFRGKSFRFTAKYPDGREEILLDVPRYDFNWQIVYLLKEPKLLPAGTVIDLEAHFDNSPNNPLNPDPNQTVYWGDQTWDEMMLGSATVSDANEDLRRNRSDADANADRVTVLHNP